MIVIIVSCSLELTTRMSDRWKIC